MMETAELERRIEEARPFTVSSAWACWWDEARSDYAIHGPYDTPEAAHRVSIPKGGFVYYDVATPEEVAQAIWYEMSLQQNRR